MKRCQRSWFTADVWRGGGRTSEQIDEDRITVIIVFFQPHILGLLFFDTFFFLLLLLFLFLFLARLLVLRLNLDCNRLGWLLFLLFLLLLLFQLFGIGFFASVTQLLLRVFFVLLFMLSGLVVLIMGGLHAAR